MVTVRYGARKARISGCRALQLVKWMERADPAIRARPPIRARHEIISQAW